MSRLFLRIFGWFVLANLVTLLITATLATWLADRSRESILSGEQPDWNLIADATQIRYDIGGSSGLQRWQDRLRRRNLHVFLVDAEGRSAAGPLPPHIAEAVDGQLGQTTTTIALRPGLQVSIRPLSSEPGTSLWFVGYRSLHDAAEPHLRLAVHLAVALLSIAVAGALITRSLIRPIHALQRTAGEVAHGRLQARVGHPYTRARDELGQLARDFDTMAERIQTLVEHTRGLLHDVSHELRSPLARLQLALELAKRAADQHAPNTSALDRAQREVQRLDRVIGEVLALARMETNMPDSQHAPIMIDELLRERLADFQHRLDERGQRCQLQLKPASLVGDRLLLGRVIDNLLDNACKFSPAAGCIEIDSWVEADEVRLRVRDHGPGIPTADASRLLQPFYRGSNAALAEGQGMGLAIVDRIVRLHGGRVSLGTAEGGGAWVEVSLPRAGDAHQHD